MRRIGSLLLAATLLVSCKDSSGPEAKSGNDFEITVSAGTRPTYTWPGGAAHSISVMRTSAPGTIVWGVAQPVLTVLTSPFLHGSVPAGALETVDDERTLTAGVSYRVSVTRQDQKQSYKDFTP